MSTPNLPPLAADAREVAGQFAAGLPGGPSAVGIEALREFGRVSDAAAPTGPDVHEVTEHQAPGPHGDVRVRLYRPESETPLPALLYMHGGGWTMGSFDGAIDYLARNLVRDSGIAIASVEYRLAPEHKFPIPVEDSYAALSWLRANAETLGIDPSLIAVGGESAGANISAAITHLDRGTTPPLAAQVLISPATEYAVERPSWVNGADTPLLTTADTLWFWDQYLRDDADRSDPRATPANAESFAELPPALVIVAGHDPLRDDGIHYAELLAKAGTPVELARFDDQFHAFTIVPSLQAYPQGLSTITTFLNKMLTH